MKEYAIVKSPNNYTTLYFNHKPSARVTSALAEMGFHRDSREWSDFSGYTELTEREIAKAIYNADNSMTRVCIPGKGTFTIVPAKA